MKNLIEKYDNLKKHPYGKAIMFFGFYIIFFIFLFSLIGIKGDKTSLLQEYEKGNSNKLNAASVLNKNYFYDFKITLDGKVYDYYGRRNGDVETFKYNNIDYYRDGDNYFMDNKGTWIKTDNPYLYYDIIDIDNLDLIMTNSFYNAKTEYENGEVDYTYLISTNTLNSILYDIDSDIEEVPNTIILSIDKDNNITKIIYKLDSLCLYNKKCKSLVIELGFDMFGNVVEISNPIS